MYVAMYVFHVYQVSRSQTFFLTWRAKKGYGTQTVCEWCSSFSKSRRVLIGDDLLKGCVVVFLATNVSCVTDDT